MPQMSSIKQMDDEQRRPHKKDSRRFVIELLTRILIVTELEAVPLCRSELLEALNLAAGVGTRNR
jgi:hypothetical protein